MANKTGNTSSKGGVIFKVITVLIGAVAVAYISVSAALSTWNPIKWKSARQGVTQNGGTINDGNDNDYNDGDLIHNTENKGISLKSARILSEDYAAYGIDAQADTAYTVTANVNTDAVDKSVIGGIAWKNADSAWASGKSVADYVTFNQVTQYGLEFTLTVKQAFGEPVIFNVASVVDSAVNATAQIDYLKALKSFTATLNPSLSATAAGRVYVGDTLNTVQINAAFGVGTIEGSITSYKTTFTTNEYYKTNLKAALLAGAGTGGFGVGGTITASGKEFKISFINGVNGNGSLTSGGGNNSAAEIIINNFIKAHGCGDSAGSSSSTAGVTSITYEIVYSYGSDYSKSSVYTDNTSYGFRNDNLTAKATITEIDLDKNNIVALPD